MSATLWRPVGADVRSFPLRIEGPHGPEHGERAADRGYGEKVVGDALHDLGVRTVTIPSKDKPQNFRPRGTFQLICGQPSTL